MHTVIIKFAGETTPTLMGITNTGYARRLALMPGVEWLQVLTPSGHLVDRSDHTRGTVPPVFGSAHVDPLDHQVSDEPPF